MLARPIVYAVLAPIAIVGACTSFDGQRTGVAEIVLEEILSVGVIQGAETEEFGRIGDLQASDDGSFFVLDEQAATVAWFDTTGAYRNGISSVGEGPGELARPVALALGRSRELAVLDPANARINIYRISPPDLIYERQVDGPWSSLGSGRNLCSIEDRWYVRSAWNRKLIHQIDAQGQIFRSFEEIEVASPDEFGPYAPIVQPQLNAGQILCLPEHRIVVATWSFDARVRAYTLDGELLWSVQIPDIRPLRPVVRDRRLTTEVDPNGGSHVARSIVGWSQESLLVQFAWYPQRGNPEDRDFHGLHSVELRLSDGEELGRAEHLPLIVDARGDRFYSYENLPYPQARVVRRSR